MPLNLKDKPRVVFDLAQGRPFLARKLLVQDLLQLREYEKVPDLGEGRSDEGVDQPLWEGHWVSGEPMRKVKKSSYRWC